MVPLVHTIAEASASTNVGRTVIYQEIRSGALRAVKRGKRTLILDEDLRQWVHSWPQLEPAKSDDPPSVRNPGDTLPKGAAAPTTSIRRQR